MMESTMDLLKLERIISFRYKKQINKREYRMTPIGLEVVQPAVGT